MGNYEVYKAINEALEALGLKNVGGGDENVNGQNGIGNDYELGDYKVKVVIAN